MAVTGVSNLAVTFVPVLTFSSNQYEFFSMTNIDNDMYVI
jgi:hypothetical protein